MLTHVYDLHRDVDPSNWATPALSQRVAYHSKVSGVPMAAIVTCTLGTYDPQAGHGKLKPISGINNLHLKVLSPGDTYDEHDIPPGYGKGQWAPLEAGLL